MIHQVHHWQIEYTPHTSMHPCTHIPLRPYTHAPIHPDTRTSIHPCIHPSTHSPSQLPSHPSINPSIHPTTDALPDRTLHYTAVHYIMRMNKCTHHFCIGYLASATPGEEHSLLELCTLKLFYFEWSPLWFDIISGRSFGIISGISFWEGRGGKDNFEASGAGGSGPAVPLASGAGKERMRGGEERRRGGEMPL